MSRNSRSMAFVGQPGQARAEHRQSSGSSGVDVCIQGWRPGLNKVQLTKTLRDAGITLSFASRLTGEILEGNEVRVHLSQFTTVEEARAALTGIGVESVRPQ